MKMALMLKIKIGLQVLSKKALLALGETINAWKPMLLVMRILA